VKKELKKKRKPNRGQKVDNKLSKMIRKNGRMITKEILKSLRVIKPLWMKETLLSLKMEKKHLLNQSMMRTTSSSNGMKSILRSKFQRK